MDDLPATEIDLADLEYGRVSGALHPLVADRRSIKPVGPEKSGHAFGDVLVELERTLGHPISETTRSRASSA